jgi:hypothetical protein
MSRFQSLSSNPTLRNFAKDASQASIRKVARFLAPLVPVPDATGYYKVYDSKHRYKRPITRRTPGQPATRLGFEATDPKYNLIPHALDFPIPLTTGMSDETMLHHAMYGAGLLADASGLDHEAETIDLAIATVGAGTDHNFASDAVDPVKLLDAAIRSVMLLAKNGASIKVLFGTDGFINFRNNAKVQGRITAGKAGAKNGSGQVSIGIEDVSGLLFGNPKCELAMMVEDTAPEGKDENIAFLLGTAILVFASNDAPNTFDASWLKTFVPMGGFMVPGVYRTQDDRDEVLKMDWAMELAATNAPAAIRLNGNAS